MRVAVIGGSGFLGSHIVDKLLILKNKVLVLDNKKNFLNKKAVFKICDILDKDKLNNFLKNVEIVFHLAGLSSLDESHRQPFNTYKNNIEGTINVLESCRLNKIKKIIFSSSLYVAGNHGGFYACSKKACENYIEEYSNTFNINYLILRYGSLYGPRSDLYNGLHKIIYQTLLTKKIIYEGEKNSSREYIHVVDAAKASVELMYDDKYLNKTINISGQQTIKIQDMLEIIREMLKINKKIEFKSVKKIGHYIRVPYNTKELPLKYSVNPHIDLGEGLNNLIDEIKKELS
jgi:UDP-glucose 4-epimerase